MGEILLKAAGPEERAYYERPRDRDLEQLSATGLASKRLRGRT